MIWQVFILFTVFANNQQAIYQADKYSIDESDEAEVIIDEIVNPNDESTNDLP